MLAKKTKKEKFNRTIIFSVFLGALIILIVGFLLYSNWKINQKRAELKDRIEELAREIQILEEKKIQLEAGIEWSQSEEYLEETAREKLGLKKPGEEVVVVTPPEGSEEGTEEEKSFWKKILEKLGF